MIKTSPASPRVLVVGESDDLSGRVARALELGGHRVTLMPTVVDIADAARLAHADAVVIETHPSDVSVLDACRALRDDGATGACPVLLISPIPFVRLQRLATLKAGAWHVFSAPLDADELRLRIERFVSARRGNDRAAEMSLIDPESGLYNAAGLARRGRELGHQAMRQHTAFSCVVLAAEVRASSPITAPESKCAAALRHAGRISDVFGRIGPMEYLILAPATNASGAALFARRIAAAVHTSLRNVAPDASVRMKVGYSSVGNLAYAPVEPTELLARAATALRGGNAGDFAWLDASDVAGITVVS